MANPVVEWAKDNPLMAGGAALAIVVVVLLVTGGGSEPEGDASGGMGSAGVQAYYSAVAMQSQAGSAIQIAQIAANAKTNQTLIGATYGLEATKVNADVSRYGYDVELFRIGSEERNNRGFIDAWREVEINNANQNANIRNNAVNLANAALGQKNLGRAERGAIVRTAITGTQADVVYKPINPGNSAAGIINAGSNLVGSFGKILPFI